jgi:hypothetical protein
VASPKEKAGGSLVVVLDGPAARIRNRKSLCAPVERDEETADGGVLLQFMSVVFYEL